MAAWLTFLLFARFVAKVRSSRSRALPRKSALALASISAACSYAAPAALIPAAHSSSVRPSRSFLARSTASRAKRALSSAVLASASSRSSRWDWAALAFWSCLRPWIFSSAPLDLKAARTLLATPATPLSTPLASAEAAVLATPCSLTASLAMVPALAPVLATLMPASVALVLPFL